MGLENMWPPFKCSIDQKEKGTNRIKVTEQGVDLGRYNSYQLSYYEQGVDSEWGHKLYKCHRRGKKRAQIVYHRTGIKLGKGDTNLINFTRSVGLREGTQMLSPNRLVLHDDLNLYSGGSQLS
jgi:hypothetical protein